MDDSRAAADQGRREEVEPAGSTGLVALPRRVVVSRRLLAIAAWLLAVAVLAQIFLAGRAVFVGPDWWQKHREFVHTFEWLAPLSVVLAYLGRATRTAKLLAWATLVLLFFAYATAGWQSSLGRHGLAPLHPVIAVLLFWAAIELARRSREGVRAVEIR
ncbi:MAG: DUF6220 domain-containing protein [Gemmatimonadaceae bacterium]